MFYAIYFSLILLTIYTDGPLQAYMGYMGCCFTPTLCYILYPIMYASGNIRIHDELTRRFAKLINYTSLLSGAALAFFFIADISMYHLGEFLPVKMVKMMLLYYSYVVTITVLINCGYKLSINQLFKPFYVGLLVSTAIAFVEVYVGEGVFNSLHFGYDARFAPDWDYNRVRLLTSESSHTATIIEVFFAVSLYYSYVIRPRSLLKAVTLFCGAFLLYSTGSKTLMLAFFIAVAYVCKELYFSRKSKRANIAVTIALIAVCILSYTILLPLFAEKTVDVMESTTLATRSYTVIVGYFVGLVSVIGTGFQSYLAYFPDLLKEFLWLIGLYLGTTNLDEIYAYIYATSDEAVTPKSFFSHGAMAWGIIGTVYLLKTFWRTVSQTCNLGFIRGNVIFKALAFVIIIQLLFSTNLDYTVISFFSLMILFRKRMRTTIHKKFKTI